MIGNYRFTTQIRCYDAPDHIFTEAQREVSIEDSIGCDMVQYWKAQKDTDDKATVYVNVLVVIDWPTAHQFLVEVKASDFFASDLEDFSKKIMGPIKRLLCKKIAEFVGDNKITKYTIGISQNGVLRLDTIGARAF